MSQFLAPSEVENASSVEPLLSINLDQQRLHHPPCQYVPRLETFKETSLEILIKNLKFNQL